MTHWTIFSEILPYQISSTTSNPLPLLEKMENNPEIICLKNGPCAVQSNTQEMFYDIFCYVINCFMDRADAKNSLKSKVCEKTYFPSNTPFPLSHKQQTAENTTTKPLIKMPKLISYREGLFYILEFS